MMHFQKSISIKLLLSSFIAFNLNASNLQLSEEILSDTRNENFSLSQKKANEDSSKLKKDWINPITYQYTKNLGEDYQNEKSVISINQPIFQSGGIYQAIKYANATHEYSTLEIVQQKKLLIKDAINFLFQIEKTTLEIKKSKLSLMNAKIDVERKKEQVLNGFLDSSFLDNALLTLNSSKHALVNLKYQKRTYINSFHNISSKNYKSFTLPNFELFNEKEYLDNNIELKKTKIDIMKKNNFSNITKAKYLPSVNAFYNYTKNHFDDGKSGLVDNTHAYGLTLTMPFDSRTFNDIESKKIDYIKSKLSLQNKISDEKTFIKSKMEKINMLNDRIEITKEDLKLYDSILNIINEEKEAELKTQSDIDTLQNSQNIKSFDLKIFEIEKQIELLEVYAKTT
jgi:outer membrane protein TolC